MVLENHPLLDSIIHKLNIKPVIFMNLDSIERFVVLSFTIVYGKCSFFFYYFHSLAVIECNMYCMSVTRFLWVYCWKTVLNVK